jgi:hypothetical protein
MTTPDEEQSAGKGGGSEAAKWRTRLRAVEQERDALAVRVAAFTRAEVERHVATRLADADADDLFVLGGVDVPDLVDEDGAVDVAAVDGAVDALLEKRPRLALGWEPDVDGFDGGARQSVSRGSGASWAGVLNGAQR